MDDVTINVLQSGSSGNCLILSDIIALDMGVTIKRITPYISNLRLVFVGHEHFDHFKASTIRFLSSQRPTLRFCGGKWMTQKFVDAGVSRKNIDVLDAGKTYDYGEFQISPVPLFHNVPNFGLKIYMNGKKVIYIVDTGSVSGIDAKGFDFFLLETNHTTAEIEAAVAEAQATGNFTYRTRAAENHLSYEQAVDWLATQITDPSKSIWVPLHQHIKKEGEHEQNTGAFATHG